VIDHAEARAAMRATIVKNIDIAVLMTRDKDFMLGQPRAEEVAGVPHLTFVSDIDPEAAENPLLFQREYFGVGVGAAMHGVFPHQKADIVAAYWLSSRAGH
jgi:hypothetical protein